MEKYDGEFKRNALRKVPDGQSVRLVAEELGVNESLIHKWKCAARTFGDGSRNGTELAEIEALKKRNRELEQENEFKKNGTHLRQRKLARYVFIDKEKKNYSFRLLCRVMEVSESGYYA